MAETHTHGGTDAPECTTCRPMSEQANDTPVVAEVDVAGLLSAGERRVIHIDARWGRLVPVMNAVDRLVARAEAEITTLRERVRVVEGERDALWEHVDDLRAEYGARAGNPSARFVRASDVVDNLPVRKGNR